MIAKDGHVQTSSKGSISFPYGAAAMTRKFAELSVPSPDHSGQHESRSPERSQRTELEETMKFQFRQAYEDLDLPESLQHKAKHGGLTLYLSGGGFPRLGLSAHVSAQSLSISDPNH